MNGRLVAKKTGAKLASKNMSVDSIMWDNFFGGSSDMAARKNEVWLPLGLPPHWFRALVCVCVCE